MAALEVGSEVWIPCDKEVWRQGIVLSFEEEAPKSSPLKTSKSPIDWVVVEVQVPKGGKGLVRGRPAQFTREEVRVPQPAAGRKVQLHLRNEILKRPEGGSPAVFWVFP